MLVAVPGYEMFVKVSNGRIVAYDIDSTTRMVDSSSVGLLSGADEEFANAICMALEIESVEDYQVAIIKNQKESE